MLELRKLLLDCWPILQDLAANRRDVVAMAVHEPGRAVFGRR